MNFYTIFLSFLLGHMFIQCSNEKFSEGNLPILKKLFLFQVVFEIYRKVIL